MMHSVFSALLRRCGRSLLLASVAAGMPGIALSQVDSETEPLEEQEVRRYTGGLIVFEYAEYPATRFSCPMRFRRTKSLSRGSRAPSVIPEPMPMQAYRLQ